MGNSQTLRPITWLGGRTYLVRELGGASPYRYLVESEDGSFKAYVRKGDSMEAEIQALMVESGQDT